MARPTPRQIIKNAVNTKTDTAVPPIALAVSLIEGYDPDDERTLLEPSLLIEPCPHPVLAAYLTSSGAVQRGRMSWIIGLGEDYSAAPLHHLLTRVAPGTLTSESVAKNSKGPRDMTEVYPPTKRNGLDTELAGTIARTDLGRHHQVVAAPFPERDQDPARFGLVTIAASDRVLWVKFATHMLVVPENLPQIPLNLRAAGRTFTDPKPVRPVDAVAVLDWAANQGLTIVDTSGEDVYALLRAKVSKSVIATPTPGQPAFANVSVGRAVFRHPAVTTSRSKLTAAANKVRGQKKVLLPFAAPEAMFSSTRAQMSAADVVELTRTLPAEVSILHPGTADIGAMALSIPVDDARLRDYQREAVGLHQSTKLGYLLAASPGMGKTVITYSAWSRRAVTRPRFRALAVVEANVRRQWANEAKIWFPEAEVVVVESSTDAPKVVEALTTHGPVVVVMSYAMLKSVNTEVAIREEAAALKGPNPPALELCGAAAEKLAEMLPAWLVPLPATSNGQLDLFSVFADEALELTTEPADEDFTVSLGAALLNTHWDDLAADEAEVLRSTGSKQLSAMWALRGVSEVAVALTGTPINKGLDDMGKMLSWVRGDRHLFYGASLSSSFDVSDDAALPRLLAALGPLVFRRDTSEISNELPKINASVMELRPSAEEKALADAARNELKRVYTELMSWLDMVSATDPDNPEFATAREALKAARGAWLGGTQLSRMACSDPASLIGSTSAGAALLAGQGLIEAATERMGTKRAAVVADTCTRVVNGHKVLIFTEFATVARGLIADLDASGVRVGSVLGGGGRRRDEMIAGFQAGELDVLVCTSSGERGLNLQQATTIVHYDLPWTPKGIVQRTGRALRIGSLNHSVDIVFPLMLGTIEEPVAALVVSRAVEAMRALDVSRGVATERTDMGMALGGLVRSVNATKAEGESDMMAMTRVLVS